MKAFIRNCRKKYNLEKWEYNAVIAFCEAYWEPDSVPQLEYIIENIQEGKNIVFWDHWNIEDLKKCYELENLYIQTKKGAIWADI